MAKNRKGFVSCVVLAGVVLASAGRPGSAQTKPESYPVAAPLSQYFISDRASEIELARSAAPASVSGEAEVLVLGQDGYTTAVKGSNGFTCLVERGWAAASDDPVFWNPRIRGPICVNAPAARSYLPTVLFKARLVLAGKSRAEISEAVKSALAGKKLPALEPNAMSYMMSKEQYLSDEGVHWHPHMMWFVPGDAVKSWGGNLAGSPTFATTDPEDGMTILMVTVDHWSDGTPAAHAAH
jgi:hypothetical protein